MQFLLAFLMDFHEGMTLQLIENYRVIIIQIRTEETTMKLYLNYKDQQ